MLLFTLLLALGGTEDDLAATITARELDAHLQFLASDLLEGRESGERGGAIAAQYIACEFEKLGLEPAGEAGYCQRFDLPVASPTPTSVSLTVTDGKGAPLLQASGEQGVIPHFVSTEGVADGAIVFCGFGLSEPDLGYDDYAQVDVRGKIVVVFRHEPGEQDEHRPLVSAAPPRPGSGRAGSVMHKVRIARERGAAALIVIPDPLHGDEQTGMQGDAAERRRADGVLPTVVATTMVGEALLGRTRAQLRELQEQIERDRAPASSVVADRHARLQIAFAARPKTAINVIGALPGSDPARRQEYVVIGAHYDHIGMRGSEVCNGADDNGSGTSGVLEIAEAFALAARRPARSVLFMAFAAEEKGLLGSAYFVAHPTVALASIKAMLNIDMIGRNKPGWVQAVAGASSSEIEAALRGANEREHMTIDDQGRFLFPASDHASFYRQGIPVLFLWTTLHADHHQPSDDVDRIDAGKMRSVARLAMRTLWRMADLSGEFHRHTIDEQGMPPLRWQ
ncbi:MAG: M28 family peptidase [Planctomycetota bacterium]